MPTGPTAPAVADEGLDLSISPSRANRQAFALALLLLALLGGAFLALAPTDRATLLPAWSAGSALVFLGCLALGIAAHEGLHALAWAAFGRIPLRRVRFGFSARALAPYAHVPEPMTARAYRLGAAMPAIVLGVLPYGWGTLTGHVGWALYGMVFVFAAAGDLLVLWQIRRVDAQAIVRDHPARVGCIVVRPAGLPDPSEEHRPWDE